MGWEEVKDEKEGYVRVRRSNTRGLTGRLKKENDDPKAKGYIELNKEDLGGMDGGGGPHSHSEYARKTHAHDDKADVNHTHDTTHTHNEFADKGHTHPPQDLTHDHFGEYAGKAEFDAHHHDGEYAEADALAQHLANHPEGGGDPYDDTQIRDDFAAADQNLQDQIDTINTSGYNDSELRGLIQGNTDALGDKSDTDHTHDPQDLTHEHPDKFDTGSRFDGENPLPLPYADAFTLGEAVDKKADEDHEHPYADEDHEHDPPDLTHDHDDYFSKGSAVDDDGNPLPLPYGDAMELGGAVNDVKEENGEQDDRLDILEAAPTVAIGDNPPADERSQDGDLWWDSVRMEMFIRYQEAWITTNALSARVEAGEQVQAELLARVAVGEEQQENLKNKVASLDTATDTLAQQNTLQNGQIQRLSSDKADTDHLHPYAHVDDVADKDHSHDEHLTNSGNQELTQTWKLKSNSKTFMTIADDKMNIYHVADPDAATHVANRNYVDTVKESLQGAISDLADKDHLHNDLAEKDHLHSDLADKDHVHDGYASTSAVDSILRPLTWKFMGSSTRAQDLGPGEFTISTSGSQNTSGGQWKIYLNPHDSSGRRLVAQVDFSHDFSNNFMVSVEHVGGGGGITGKSQNFYFNVDGSPNKYHRLETNWWKVAYSLSTGQEYIIQIPGMLPTFGDASASSTLRIDESVDGELPASDEQEEQVND